MEIRRISTSDEEKQYVQLIKYCFVDPIGWSDSLFPLKDGDIATGCFFKDKLAAGTLSKNLKVSIFNSVEPMTGISVVATAPQSRNLGLIKKLIPEILRTEYKAGKTLTSLFPFKFEFYEKLGYGFLGGGFFFNIEPDYIKKYPVPAGEFTAYSGLQEQVDAFYSLRNKWAAAYDFGILIPVRSLDEFNNERKIANDFIYFHSVSGVIEGFIQYRLKPTGINTSEIEINRIAWTNPQAFCALVYFLYTHRNQCTKIIWFAPDSLPLYLITEEPRLGEVRTNGWMARPLNVSRLLELKLKINPAPDKIVFSIKDDIIEENTKTYTLEGTKITYKEYCGENPLSMPVFSALLFGGYSLESAILFGLCSGDWSKAAFDFFKKSYNTYITEQY